MAAQGRILFAVAGLALTSFGPSFAADEADAATWLERLEHGTLAERTAAVRWLGLHLVTEARDPLSEQLRAAPHDAAHAEFRRTAELMVQLLWSPRMLELHDVDAVIAQLAAPQVHLRVSAVRHLAYYAPPGAVERAAAFLDDPADLVREEAISTLRWLGDRRHADRVLALLADPGAAIRLRALEYLLELDRPELLPRLVVVAADPSPWIAQPAVRALQEEGRGPAAAAALLARLRDELPADELARYLAALERFEDRADFPRRWIDDVRPLLAHPHDAVRRQAAVLIGDDDPNAAREVLVGLLASADPVERLAAAQALAAADWPLDAATIERLLDDVVAPVRVAAVELSATLPPERRRKLLLQLFDRPAEESDVLARALAALIEVGRADDVGLLVAWMPRAATEHVRINATLTMAALERRWDTRAARDWFRGQLADPTVERPTRQAIVRALQVVGDPSFLSLLADELRAVPPEDTQYATALVQTMSVLVGRQVHGVDFGDAAVPAVPAVQ